LATSIAINANQIGIATSFIVGGIVFSQVRPLDLTPLNDQPFSLLPSPFTLHPYSSILHP